MPREDERLDRMARIIEASTGDGSSFEALDLDAHRAALGADFAELEDLVEVERMLETYMEPPDSVRLPRDLGGYRLEKELGRGGMGVVYEAVARATGQRVAVKVLRMGYVGRADARARFRREAQALARVRHPNIVDFLEAGDSEEQPFYAMSLIDGPSLEEALESAQPPSARSVAQGLADVADALDRLHESGLVHRDVKPANVVLASDGRMVLADFGLATGDDFLTVTRTGDALGTPAYMAPEQVLGKKDAITAQTDVYGLGATLYHALTRHPPFEADDAHSLASAILEQRPRPPRTHAPGVPPALERIALKALEKDSTNRYASAAGMRDDLRAFGTGRAAPGPGASALQRGARALGRNPSQLAVVLAVLASVAFFVLRDGSDASTPDPEVATPGAVAAAPGPEATTPGPAAAEPAPAPAAAPKTETPKPEAPTPDPPASAPSRDAPAPKPNPSTQGPDSRAPDPAGLARGPDASTPEPDAATADPDPTTPSPRAPVTRPHGKGLALPGKGKLYHGVFPGDDESVEDAHENGVTAATLASYESAVHKKAAWVCFSHNWYQGRAFPLSTATWIRKRGSVPFIRLMMRSSWEQDVAEPVFTPAHIAAGRFDADLVAWGKAAAAFKTPLLVEYGTTVNGSWYPWNGQWNGGARGGPDAFKRAYRHIVRTVSDQGASNITWVFHVYAYDAPDVAWNRLEKYYPGDDVVDWVGASVYGADSPTEDEWSEFAEDMDAVYPRLVAMAPGKPVAVLALGVSGGNPLGKASTWARDALRGLKAGKWPAVVGFCWWNDYWENDDDQAHNTEMRVQKVPGLAKAIAKELASPKVLADPVLSK